MERARSSRGGYIYAPDRKAERPIAHLAGFQGVLQVDGYAGYRALAEKGQVRLAFCWSHVRRRFYELAAAGLAPIASEALKRVGELYAVEAEIRGRSAEARPVAPGRTQADLARRSSCTFSRLRHPPARPAGPCLTNRRAGCAFSAPASRRPLSCY